MIKEKDYLVYRLAKVNPKGMAYKGKDFPTSYRVPSECVVFDKESKRPVQLRYVVGEPELLRSKQRRDQVKAPSIEFVEGFLTVNKNETTLIEYLSMVGWNEAIEEKQHNQSTIFKLIDEGKVAEEDFTKEEDSGRAVTLFWNTYDDNPDTVKAAALSLGINIDDYKWKSNIIKYVKANPVKFRNLIENREELEGAIRVFDIVKASQNEIVTFANSRWSWTGGSPIVTVSRGKNPYKVLADLTFSGASGAAIWDNINKKLNPDTVIATPEVNALDVLKFDELLVLAKEKDIIVWNTKKKKFIFNHADGEEMIVSGSAKGVIKRMDEDEAFVESIKKRME